MSAEKTPETYEVEEAYAYAVSVDCGEPRGECDHRAEFKRWLAAHDAEVAAQAWDEGYGTGWVDGEQAAHGGKVLEPVNPYRAEAARHREGKTT